MRSLFVVPGGFLFHPELFLRRCFETVVVRVGVVSDAEVVVQAYQRFARVGSKVVRAVDHLVQLELGRPLAACFEGLVEVFQEESDVDFAKVSIAEHESEVHPGIGNSALEGKIVVLVAQFGRVLLGAEGIMQAGEGKLHIGVALVCQCLDFVDVFVELRDMVFLVCYAQEHRLTVAVCHHILGCCPEGFCRPVRAEKFTDGLFHNLGLLW